MTTSFNVPVFRDSESTPHYTDATTELKLDLHHANSDLGIPTCRPSTTSLLELSKQAISRLNHLDSQASKYGILPKHVADHHHTRFQTHEHTIKTPNVEANTQETAHHRVCTSTQPHKMETLNQGSLVNYEDLNLPPAILKAALSGPRRPKTPPPVKIASPPQPPSLPPAPSASLELAQLDAAHTEIQELKHMIKRQDVLLLWYTSHRSPPPPSTLSTLHKLTRNEYLAEESKKESDVLHSHILALKQTTQHQKNTIDTLVDETKALETRVTSTMEKLEKSVKSNKQLLSKVDELDTMCVESEKKWMDSTRERDRAQRWIRAYQGSIEDYESCVRESGLASILHDDIIRDVTPGSLLLTRHVQNMVKELQDLNRKLGNIEHEFDKEKKNHAAGLQKYMLDFERKNAELLSTKDRLKEITFNIDRVKEERDHALEQMQKLTKENSLLEDSIKRVTRSKDEEIDELLTRSKNQLSTIREQSESVRIGMQTQIDMLQKSKIDLQVEVGKLSRERRSVTYELEAVHRNIALTRDQFRRDLGLM
ncbi:hypothetical protein BATDEDRAFT_92679 [Batrachochytrium dendrobatidis JAM81]|uniref:Uncharacterized protein n=1 Tax=Batrachochytrium dendrobatidis (strain JAM81 / FGSC 10211) TaxID=684364 RepID=F4PE94_BATDJ|nr:uncharacterized protein BATDEDRAFT_92679 [Batrachochytrium dendrobatidis JAM81]EGF76519.1 hypothetical protein BATDEDRAFT_92679 [Batrachochytrium dendrobatidis JAM81]|eukprot:XP_006682895.1 hypothetical protein BATDEDRAFT_92679 [Batrachochytrium dendrobatidis JAM81]